MSTEDMRGLLTRAARLAKRLGDTAIGERLRDLAMASKTSDASNVLARLLEVSRAAVHVAIKAHDMAIADVLGEAVDAAFARARSEGILRPLGLLRADVPAWPTASRERPQLRSVARRAIEKVEELAPAEDDLKVESTSAVDLALFEGEPRAAANDAPPRETTASTLRIEDSAARTSRLSGDVVAQAFESIAMLARHRAERPWHEISANEVQLLTLVDAIAAAGSDAGHDLIASYLRSFETPDAWATWAIVHTLGTFDGPDIPDAIVAVMERVPRALESHASAAAGALAVSPRTDVAAIARDLTRSPHPIARAAGVEALALLDQVAADELPSFLSDPHPIVLRAAVRAARRAPPERGPFALLPLLQHPDAGVARAVARQLLIWKRPEPLQDVRTGKRVVQTLGEDALEILVVAGHATDAERFDAILMATPMTAMRLSAIARFGAPTSWALVVHFLGDSQLGDAALDALVTLFGLIVPPEEEKSAAAWRDAIARAKLEPDLRYRGGRPWRPSVVVDECRAGRFPRRELELRLDELSIRVGAPTDIDVRRWSPEVLGELDSALRVAATVRWPPGGWSSGRR